MKDSERLRWEADQIQWDPAAFARSLKNSRPVPCSSSSTMSNPPMEVPGDPAAEDAMRLHTLAANLRRRATWAEKEEKDDRRAEYARRGKENQQKGSQWEGVVLQFFTRLGYKASRVLETHGYTKGWDIGLKELPGLVIQCKNTQTKAALLNGLEEARKHNSDQVGWVCFHRFRVKKAKKGQQYTYLVAYSGAPSGPVSITDLESFYRIMERAPGQYPGG